MASVETITPYYLLQPSFATGEISAEVANRVDLDKYQAALTKAENCLIRPYGPAYKRYGSQYVADCKNANSKCMLTSFSGVNNIDYLLEIGAGYIRIYKQGTYLYEVATPFTVNTLSKLRFTQSADVMFIASGDYPLKTLTRYADNNWAFGDYSIAKPYFDESIGGGSDACTITPSGTGGNVTLTSNEGIFTSNMVGMSVQLKHDVASATVSVSGVSGESYSGSVYCGESWKVITHGTWTGTVKVQYSTDNSTWRDYRTYTSKNDYNPTESGNLSEGRYLRFYYNVSSGSVTIDLTRLSYVETGYAKIYGYSNANSVSAAVQSRFGDTAPTKQWSFSAWCPAYGYPKTVAFFQDRLCLGGNNNQPYMLWMSRTGDYNNFSVEKASGNITDDSAIALSFVSRKQFEINHLVPHTDLLIFTKGNEWIVSGSEVVTPSHATPRLQTTRGCGDTEPVMIGNKTVFVQGRGSVVRDMGYSYETDCYGGMDLTLLDKQIIQSKQITDATYMQEPNSSIYFIRNDGSIAILTYVIDQKVYAWSTFKTDGLYESICAVAEGDEDTLYVVTKRTVNDSQVRYIEKFQNDKHSNVPNDYIMLDCASVFHNNTPTNTLSVPKLKGLTVSVLGDGREYKDIDVAANGTLTLPTTVTNAIVGLPYAMTLELPNVEIKGRDGTMQGRFKDISGVIVRLDNSLGGSVGPNLNTLDDIHYDEFQSYESVNLYSGDKKMQVAVGGFDTTGRISIFSDDPYPFHILAIVREVSLGG